MTWDLLSPTTTAYTYSPMARLASEMQERGGAYTYGAPGWAAYKGGVTRASSNAALSALTLLSFLFFLNLLQQQLSSGQQQTLLFMVNNTAPVAAGRESRETKQEGGGQPYLAAGAVHETRDSLGRKMLTAKTPRNAKNLKRSRKVRDVRGDTSDKNRQVKAANRHNDNYVVGETSTPHSPPAPKPLVAPPTKDRPPPVMMEGLQSGSTMQLSAWLKGQLSASELRADLADTLTNCRAVVACTIYQESTVENKTVRNESRVKRLLAEAGEYAEPGHLEEACESLLLSAGADCGALAQSFSMLLK